MSRKKKEIKEEMPELQGPQKLAIDGNDALKLIDLASSKKNLVDIAREILKDKYTIVQSDVYNALLEEHNNIQEKCYNADKELTELKKLYEDEKEIATSRSNELRKANEYNDDLYSELGKQKNDLDAAKEKIEEQNKNIESLQSKLADYANEVLQTMQEDEDKVSNIPTASVKVEHKISENTSVTLGYSEPLGDRSLTTAHEEVYLKVLSSLDNITELSK